MRTAIIISVILATVPITVLAQWGGFGAPVMLEPGDQSVHGIVGDGSGGAIIVCTDLRRGWAQLYAQRLDSTGTRAFTPGGVALAPGSSNQTNARVQPDGLGGAIVVWTENSRVRAQRIASDGSMLWGEGGVAVCDTASSQSSAALVSVAPDTFVVVWTDSRVGKVFGQKIARSGQHVWAPYGVQIGSGTSNVVPVHAASDNGGNVYVTWRQSGFHVQLINSAGTKQLGSSGVTIASHGGPYEYAICYDGVSGLYVVIPGGDGVWVTKVSDTGTQVFETQVSPFTIGDDAAAIADGSGGVYAIWTDDSGSPLGVHIQHVGGAGGATWPGFGLDVRDVSRSYDKLEQATSDGMGGVFIATSSNHLDTYDERIHINYFDTSGPRWTTGGLLVSSADGDEWQSRVTATADGAIVAWSFNITNSEDSDVWAQRSGHDGTVNADLTPKIRSVSDVPDDQGGKLSIRWSRSSVDLAPHRTILNYSVWRSVGSTSQVSMASGNHVRVIPIAGAPHYWEQVGTVPAHYFEHYAFAAPTVNDSVPGRSNRHYFIVSAQTSDPWVFYDSAVDSGSSVDNLAPVAPSGLMAEAADDGALVTWDPNGEPDLSHYDLHGGYNPDFMPAVSNLIASTADTSHVDTSWLSEHWKYYKLIARDIHANASQAALTNAPTLVAVAVQQFSAVYHNGTMRVSWALSEPLRNGELLVLRSTEGALEWEDVVRLSVGDRVAFDVEDQGVSPGESYIYELQYVDGASGFTLYRSAPVKVPGIAYTLYQNSPNPFNMNTQFRFYLPEADQVTLMVYDVAGRKVSTLASGEYSKGIHVVGVSQDAADSWGPAGVYFVRLTGQRLGAKSIKATIMR